MPWQSSKVLRPHGPSTLNSFSMKSKLISPLESTERDEQRTAVNMKRGPLVAKMGQLPLSFVMECEGH